MTDQAYVGIVVSQATLHACLWREKGKYKDTVFANTEDRHPKRLRWAQFLAGEQLLHFCMEATGAYSTLLAQFLAEQAQAVSIVHPAQIKDAAATYGAGHKTDKADARTIATCARKEQPALW
jgi:transposase